MIDSSDVVSYDNGWNAGYKMGFSDCKEELMKVLKEVALRAATHENPGLYVIPDEKLRKIMVEAGLGEELLD